MIGTVAISRSRERVKFTGQQYRIVEFLSANLGEICSYDAIIAVASPPGRSSSRPSIKMQISKIRRKLRTIAPAYTVTNVYAVGFIMEKQE